MCALICVCVCVCVRAHVWRLVSLVTGLTEARAAWEGGLGLPEARWMCWLPEPGRPVCGQVENKGGREPSPFHDFVGKIKSFE